MDDQVVVLMFGAPAIHTWEGMGQDARDELGRTLGLLCRGERPDGVQQPWQGSELVWPGGDFQAILRPLTGNELLLARPTSLEPHWKAVCPGLRRVAPAPSDVTKGYLVSVIETARRYGAAT